MKTITVYELSGLVKDGKAPKKIKYENYIYELTNNGNDYYNNNNGYLFININDEVEIIEEEKNIPDKLESYISCGWNGTCKDLKREELFEDLKKIGSKINEIIDYLKSKGE